jgi:hypothetical protein
MDRELSWVTFTIPRKKNLLILQTYTYRIRGFSTSDLQFLKRRLQGYVGTFTLPKPKRKINILLLPDLKMEVTLPRELLPSDNCSGDASPYFPKLQNQYALFYPILKTKK